MKANRVVLGFNFASGDTLAVSQGLVPANFTEEQNDAVFDEHAKKMERSKRFIWMTDKVTKQRYMVNLDNVNVVYYDFTETDDEIEESHNAS